MIRRFLAMLAFVFALAALPTPAAAIPSNCTGKFVNPITDICWSCLFPLSVGGLPIWPGSRPDTKNPALPVCACGSPVPRIGIAIGFWEPARMVDVTTKPWCFPNLGGLRLNPGLDIGQGQYTGPQMLGGRTANSADGPSAPSPGSTGQPSRSVTNCVRTAAVRAPGSPHRDARVRKRGEIQHREMTPPDSLKGGGHHQH